VPAFLFDLDGTLADNVWDLLAARRAGALGVGLLSGGYGQDELEQAGAYRVYQDPADLLKHLDGCRGYRVTAAQELQPILEDAFRQPVPAVVACPVDYDENLRLTEKLGAWVCP